MPGKGTEGQKVVGVYRNCGIDNNVKKSLLSGSLNE